MGALEGQVDEEGFVGPPGRGLDDPPALLRVQELGVQIASILIRFFLGGGWGVPSIYFP